MAFRPEIFEKHGEKIPRDLDGKAPELGDDLDDFRFDFTQENAGPRYEKFYRAIWWPTFVFRTRVATSKAWEGFRKAHDL